MLKRHFVYPPQESGLVKLSPSLFLFDGDTERVNDRGSSLYKKRPILICWSIKIGAFCSKTWRSNALAGCVLSDRYTVLDRKSTRLNSSHVSISYAVFC